MFKMTESERTIASAKKKLIGYERAMNYIKLLEPKYFMPIAGRYTYSGKLAKYNDKRGEPELEEGFDDYTEYDGDGGHTPNTEPSAHGYIHFENRVRGFYAGGPKTTPSRFSLEIVGSSGYININDQEAKVYKNDEVTPISAPKWDVIGIEAGVQNLVQLVDQGGKPASSGNEALKTVEIMIGFLESQRHHNTKINLARVRRRMPG